MPYFTSAIDGARLFYRDYVPSTTPTFAGPLAIAPPPITAPQPTLVFLHGWPMSSKMFERLTVALCETHRFRIIAPDRRGFGNSDWTGNGGETKMGSAPQAVTFDTFVGDAVALLQSLELDDFVLLGASMGAQQAVLAWAGSEWVKERCKGFVGLGANMPFPVQCPENPNAPPSSYLDTTLIGPLRASKLDFTHAALPSIFASVAADTPNPSPDTPVLSGPAHRWFESLIAQADALAVEKTALLMRRSVGSELKKVAEYGKPMLLLHGEKDAGLPLETSVMKVKEIVPWADVKVYEGAGHGLYYTHAERVVEDIVSFVAGLKSEGGS